MKPLMTVKLREHEAVAAMTAVQLLLGHLREKVGVMSDHHTRNAVKLIADLQWVERALKQAASGGEHGEER